MSEEKKTLVRILDKWVEWRGVGMHVKAWPFEAIVADVRDLGPDLELRGATGQIAWTLFAFGSPISQSTIASGKADTLDLAAEAILAAARSTFRHALNVYRDAGAEGPFVREEPEPKDPLEQRSTGGTCSVCMSAPPLQPRGPHHHASCPQFDAPREVRVDYTVKGAPDTDASQVARGIVDALANGTRVDGRLV